MKTSKATFEKNLNQQYSDCYSDEDMFEQLIYLTNKTRNGGYISEKKLREQIRLGKSATLLRKYDPIAFTCEFNERN